jgi:hypothetical protein
MTVVMFPKRPLPAHLSGLTGYQAEAARRGVATMAIQHLDAAEAATRRLQAILELEELQIFGRLSNPLSMHFGFKTALSVDEVRAQTVAIRQALAEIGVAGMAFETKETSPHE